MRKISAITVIVLFALSIPSPSSALNLPWDTTRLDQLWQSVQALFDPGWTTTKAGQCMDPDGVPVTCPNGDQVGAEIDPAGASGPGNEVGAEIDPNGADGG